MELTPEEISLKLIEAAEEYSSCGDRLTEILITKTAKWLLIRKDVKSDRMADMLWDDTEPGRQELMLRTKIKGLEKLMSAYKTRMQLLNQTYFNQYEK